MRFPKDGCCSISDNLSSFITSDECHAWFHFYGTSLPTRSVSKIQAYQLFTILGLESTILKCVAWCTIDGSTRALIKVVLLKRREYTEREKKRMFTLGVIFMKYVLFVYMNLCLKFWISISARIVIHFFAKR